MEKYSEKPMARQIESIFVCFREQVHFKLNAAHSYTTNMKYVVVYLSHYH